MKRLKLALAKGRLYDEVAKLLDDCELGVCKRKRSYRPYVADDELDIKLIKPQNIPKLVEYGSQDLAFTGNDMVIEQEADVVELLDINQNPVRIVAAIPKDKDVDELKKQRIRVASEYENLSKRYLDKKGFKYDFIKSYGATESFVPEDADMIIENTSTGETLKENNLKIVDEILSSSTRIIANREALNDPWKKKKIDDLIMLFKSVLEARKRVLVEMNVSKELIDDIIPILPCMRSPTVAKLYGDEGYAVRIAVEKKLIPKLIPQLKGKGVTDILVLRLKKVIE